MSTVFKQFSCQNLLNGWLLDCSTHKNQVRENLVQAIYN